MMTDSQRSLCDSYEGSLLVYWDRESEVLQLRSVAEKRGEPSYVDQQLAKSDHDLRGRPLPHRYAVDYPSDWIRDPWRIPARLENPEFFPTRHDSDDSGEWVSYMTHVYPPHSCGKGRGQHAGPYHIRCTGCSEEVKLWEFGVDYDVG